MNEYLVQLPFIDRPWTAAGSRNAAASENGTDVTQYDRQQHLGKAPLLSLQCLWFRRKVSVMNQKNRPKNLRTVMNVRTNGRRSYAGNAISCEYLQPKRTALLVSLFGVCEFGRGILRQIRREEARGFGKCEVEVRQRLHLQPELAIAGAIEQMAALLAVLRQKMEVVAGNAECA